MHTVRVEGEEVARQVNRNREWTRICANLEERDRPCRAGAQRRRIGRGGVRLATRSKKKGEEPDVFGETPNTATGWSEQHKSSPLRGLVALPTHRISEHSRFSAFIRGSMRKSLISKTDFTQVVDFQDRPYVTR